jgi:hypothetical protein
MSQKRRRRPDKGGGAKGGAAKASPPAKTSGGGRKPPTRHRPGGADFWGRAGAEPSAGRIRPTTDPGALPRSLGDPPIGHDPTVAAGHLAVIYEEAVRAATALAAANGLLEDESEDGEAG